MATNLAIDNILLNKAFALSGLKTKKDVVNLALKEFINSCKQLETLEIFGEMEPDQDYDYKKGRTR